MTLYTSGDWKVDFGGEVTHDVFDFCCEQWNPLKDAEIEVVTNILAALHC